MYNGDVVEAPIKIQKSPGGDTRGKITRCLASLKRQFMQSHSTPWIICFSGGKDSTLLMQFVFEMLQSRDIDPARRDIHIIANDTLVESPLVASHLDKQLAAIRKYVKANGLPVNVKKTQPKADQTFWVNLIGKGYASPNRLFRWCTQRLKIEPTTSYIKRKVAENGKVIVLLGVRSDESTNRAREAARHTVKNSDLHPHSSLQNCMVFRPILDLSTDELWTVLLQRRPPWGGSHRELITLYRNALGGECPIMTDISDAPACGGKSPRFGCWTCTVVSKDRSLEGLVQSGFEDLEPLTDFRDFLANVRSQPIMRMKRRRNGAIMKRADGSTVRAGPFTIRARKMILAKLEELQAVMGNSLHLISESEKGKIRKIWEQDERQYARTGRLSQIKRGVN